MKATEARKIVAKNLKKFLKKELEFCMGEVESACERSVLGCTIDYRIHVITLEHLRDMGYGACYSTVDAGDGLQHTKISW